VGSFTICTFHEILPGLKNEMGGACGTYGETKGAYRFWGRKTRQKKPPARTRCRWEDKVNLQEMKWVCVGGWVLG
jgi:hypothetical protein